jgi:hypothetical protein
MPGKLALTLCRWISVESYIKGISGRRASHGIGPKCYEKELQNDELMNN